MEKRGSLKGINLFILILKVILDAVSRILLFSTWLYVINSGQFSSWITVTAYYVTFVILLIFNIEANQVLGKHGHAPIVFPLAGPMPSRTVHVLLKV